MTNGSTLSLPEIEDRIAILRDNIRQLTEQAAALSGAADEARAADRIAAQQADLDRLIAERDAILARRAAAARPPAPKAKPAAKKKAVKKKAVREKDRQEGGEQEDRQENKSQEEETKVSRAALANKNGGPKSAVSVIPALRPR